MPSHTRLRPLACLAATLALAGPAAPAAPAGAPFTVEDLVRLKRVSDPQLSPDGRYVAYVQRETDMEADQGRTSLWLAEPGGGAPRRLTGGRTGDSSPRWASDSRTLYFLST